MSDSPSTLETILQVLAEEFSTLDDYFEDEHSLLNLLENIGWAVGTLDNAAVEAIRTKVSALSNAPFLVDDIEALVQADTNEEVLTALASLGVNLGTMVATLKEIADTNWDDLGHPFDTTEFEDLPLTLGQRVIDLLLTNAIAERSLKVLAILELLGLIREEPIEAGAEPDSGAMIRVVDWSWFSVLLSDPKTLVRHIYHWDDTEAPFDADRLVKNLANVLTAFDFTSRVFKSRAVSERYYGTGMDPSEHPQILNIAFFSKAIGDLGYAETGLNVIPVPHQLDSPPAGLLLFPYALGSAGFEVPISGDLKLKIALQGAAGDLFGIRILPPPTGVSFELPDGNTVSSGNVEIALTYEPTSQLDLFTIPGGIGLYLGGFTVGIGASLNAQDPEVALKLDISEASITIDGSDGDGFLQYLLPKGEIRADFDLGVVWSNVDGLKLTGSGALEVTLPVHIKIANVLGVDSIYLSLGMEPPPVSFSGAISTNVKLGPISANIHRFGLRGTLKEQDGNLGSAHLATNFLPPTAAGFALDASVLVGGGFLDFDDENKRYSGALALMLGEIGITAVGLITTRMPDGSDGFSMLVNIGITFEPAIQIYMGFTLSGVGGLVGVNRTMETAVLREGVKKGTLDSILFPKPSEVIANAAQIISDMRAVFPPEDGRFVVGPMLQFGWGTPTVIVGEIGVFIEQPDPVRVVLMGQMEMALPEPDKTIVGVNIDILGVLDPEKKELSFQASVYGSSFMAYEFFGDCAFFLRWGNKSELAFAIGGFHPKFTAPPPRSIFSDLRRLGVNLNYGPLVQLQCQGGYMALTPNSLQFGARVGVFVGVEAVNAGISGSLSFDALIYLSPSFSFEVGLGGGMSVSVMDQTLADVWVSCVLAGPTPWNIRGDATVKVLFVDVDVGFNISWGRSDSERLDAIDPWPLLEEALKRAESWGSQLPPGTSIVEALRKIEDEHEQGAGGGEPLPLPVVVHPAETLEIRQNVAPLETTLAKFGNAPVRHYDRFRIDKVTTRNGGEHGDELARESVEEFFARGQFEELSSSQKLSIPSFEKMPGGVTTKSSNRISCKGELQSKRVEYESILIKPDRTTQKASIPKVAVSKWAEARFLSAGNAARRGALRSQGRARFARRGEGLVGTQEEKYVVVESDTLKEIDIGLDDRVDVPKGGMTRTQADQALAQHLSFHPDQTGRFSVVAEYEVEEAA